MGYQTVDVVLKSGEIIKDAVVLNAEDIKLPDEYSWLKLENISDVRVKK